MQYNGSLKSGPLTSSRTSLNDTELPQPRPLFRKTYGFKFYGGSGIKRNNFREVAERPFFFEHPLGPLASKASFNPKAAVLPDIGSVQHAKSVEEVRARSDTVMKKNFTRRNFSRKYSEKKQNVKSKSIEADPKTSSDTMRADPVEVIPKKKSLNPFAATFFLKRFIRQKRGALDAVETEKDSDKADDESVIEQVTTTKAQSRFDKLLARVEYSIRICSLLFP
jgi:hypothetical protein